MKLSAETQAILKNFSTINRSIVIRPGNVIRTMHVHGTSMAIAQVAETFPRQAGIYDLPRFLSVASLYKDPDINFHEKHVTISEGNSRAKYVYADPSMIVAPPNEDMKLPEPIVAVKVTADDLMKLQKASGVFQLPEIAVVGEDGKCFIRALDRKNPTADSYDVALGNTDKEFSAVVRTENIRVLPANYVIEVMPRVLHFKSESLQYIVAVES